MNDSVDKISAATYITKVDLVKRYWQVPFSKRAIQVASFVVNGALWPKERSCHLPEVDGQSGGGLKNCAVYDDVVVFDTCWEEHLNNMEALVRRLEEAGLVVILIKCEFVQASVQYLGYVVGHGQVSPPQAKVEAIKNFKAPHCRRALQRFLGMIGYYRRFIRGYSTVLAPLTDLLRKDTK